VSSPTSAETDECRALDRDLGWGLGVVFRAYVKATGEAMADVPGGPRGFQVLAAAAGDRPGTQLALARQLGIDRTVMTYLLDDLESAGLVRRTADPQDRRARRVIATEAGHTVLGDLNHRRRTVEEHLLAGITDADRATLRSVLAHIALRLDAADPVTGACQLAAELGVEPDPGIATSSRTRPGRG
jgi:DNA-binding MarR family transcriptional regulator